MHLIYEETQFMYCLDGDLLSVKYLLNDWALIFFKTYLAGWPKELFLGLHWIGIVPDGPKLI